MIIKFVAWRLAVAAAFAVCVAVIHSAPAAAATETAARPSKAAGMPVARVHTLRGTSLQPARPQAQLQASVKASHRFQPQPAVSAAASNARPIAHGVVLEDGTFAAYANY